MATEVRFSVVRRMLVANGWRLTRISGSHHIFTKVGHLPISVPVHGKKVKAVYVRKIEQLCKEGQD